MVRTPTGSASRLWQMPSGPFLTVQPQAVLSFIDSSPTLRNASRRPTNYKERSKCQQPFDRALWSISYCENRLESRHQTSRILRFDRIRASPGARPRCSAECDASNGRRYSMLRRNRRRRPCGQPVTNSDPLRRGPHNWHDRYATYGRSRLCRWTAADKARRGGRPRCPSYTFSSEVDWPLARRLPSPRLRFVR
jgi:hypothetical protein